MSSLLLGLLAAVVGIGLGTFIGYQLREKKAKSSLDDASKKAEAILREAEIKQTEALGKAKEKAIKIIEEARLEEKRAFEDLKTQQAALNERETMFGQKLLDIDKAKQEVEAAQKRLEEAHANTELLKADVLAKLQEVASLSKDQALTRLMDMVEDENKEVLLGRMRKLDEATTEEIDRKAKNILAVAIQKQASSHVVETTTTLVQLPSEEMKGRNIKAIELLTGCELIVDDTPGAVTVSGFSPIRRQVAKRALEKLIADGRIHPGRIEEFVDEAKRDLQLDIRKAGEDALFELGLPTATLDPKLVQILGRLKFRTSYGQNALLHSMEVARLSAMLGEELKADVHVCKLGGLLHDIGKAVDHDMQGSHPEIGYQIMQKYGFPEEIAYQSIGHHEDKPKTLEAIIVKAADAISGARPGARKDSLEFYVKRLQELENAAMSFGGVEKVYAIQAGREIRVFVNPKQIDDYAAQKLAKDIANKIEGELKFPGEVRVTLIREMRVTEYAK